jgi:hypothetical protein
MSPKPNGGACIRWHHAFVNRRIRGFRAAAALLKMRRVYLLLPGGSSRESRS